MSVKEPYVTVIGNAFGPGRSVQVCTICAALLLMPRDDEPDWISRHIESHRERLPELYA